jgi:hypothetical protein
MAPFLEPSAVPLAYSVPASKTQWTTLTSSLNNTNLNDIQIDKRLPSCTREEGESDQIRVQLGRSRKYGVLLNLGS